MKTEWGRYWIRQVSCRQNKPWAGTSTGQRTCTGLVGFYIVSLPVARRSRERPRKKILRQLHEMDPISPKLLNPGVPRDLGHDLPEMPLQGSGEKIPNGGGGGRGTLASLARRAYPRTSSRAGGKDLALVLAEVRGKMKAGGTTNGHELTRMGRCRGLPQKGTKKHEKLSNES
jgi:hypothetical protein